MYLYPKTKCYRQSSFHKFFKYKKCVSVSIHRVVRTLLILQSYFRNVSSTYSLHTVAIINVKCM